MKILRLLRLSSTVLLPALLLTGCGVSNFSIAKTEPVAGSATSGAQGIFMGGQQPVGGVSLQLYAVGTSGYGSAASPLLTPGAVKTTASGNFTLPTFSCPTPGSLVYLVGTGGQPIAANGGTAAVTNNNLALMAGLGACSTISSRFINVNELTTVATVWALSPFMTGPANIGSTSTNPIGIANAFAAINSVVNTANGTLPGLSLPANGALPTAEINTLADILEQCVNSGGGTASDSTTGADGTPCGNLFYLAPSAAGVSPAETITAALNIAQTPARNVAKLNQLRSASPVFLPALSVNAPPTAWTIAITYTGNGLSGARGLANDQAGNVWVANAGGSSVSQFAPSGAPLANTVTANTKPVALAIDLNGNAWVANTGNNTVSVLPAGTVLSSNGLNTPMSIAIDSNGNAWIANTNGNSTSVFTSSGAILNGSPFTGGGLSAPAAIAISGK